MPLKGLFSCNLYLLLLCSTQLKPCYGKLVKPKLAEGVQFNTERVVKMAGQGAVYVRSLYPLTVEDEDDEDLYQSTLEIR